MQKYNLLLAAIMVNFMTFAQVGINTPNPQGIFNIDGAKDNPTTGSAHTAAQQLNDFTVLASGYVGIGTTAPTQKLEIKTGGTSATPVTGFKLADGNENTNYVLTSDATGVGTWKPAGNITYKLGTHIANNFVNIPFVGKTANDWYSTGSYVTLAPGIWKVDINQLLGGYVNNNDFLTADEWMWFRFSFTDDASWGATPIGAVNANTPLDPNRPSHPLSDLTQDFVTLDFTNGTVISSGPQYVSNNYDGPRIASPTRFEVVNGTFLIRNNTSAPKTYYLCANPYNAKTVTTAGHPNFFFRNVGASNWGENRIIASYITLTN